jgi:hypothetical protein
MPRKFRICLLMASEKGIYVHNNKTKNTTIVALSVVTCLKTDLKRTKRLEELQA